jgi:hypothetical protein
MAIDKLTPRYLNFEDDERLVKRIEMTDAVNIRIDSDDDGDAGVIKNVVGNTQVGLLGDPLPSGDNKVIGSVHNNVKGEILFFVHNSDNNHRIYKYDDNLEKVFTVYKNEATGTVASASADTLGFKATDYVDAAVLVDKDGDTLLYFTNGRGEPKKINVDKAIRGDYPDGYEGVEAYISLIKKPPLEPPTFEFESRPELGANRLLGKQFQFACQYVYDDGEVSAISPISKITKPASHINLGFFNNLDLVDIDNLVKVSCKRINSDIKKIRFLAREGNSGVFFIIEDVDTSFSSSGLDEITIEFSNEKAYTPISNNENNKLFDAVGMDVRSISISGNRIFLGNYTEGFDLDSSVKENCTVLPNYHPKSSDEDVSHPEDDSGVIEGGMFINHSTPISFPINTGLRDEYLSHFTKIDLSSITSKDFNSFVKFNLSFNFTNLFATYYKNGRIKNTGVIGDDFVTLFRHELGNLGDIVQVNLSQNYANKEAFVDDIVSSINNLPEFSVLTSARSGPGGVVNAAAAASSRHGVEYTGTMKIKVVAQRNFTGFSGALAGDSVVTLFLKPISVSAQPTNNNFDLTGLVNVEETFSSPTIQNADNIFNGLQLFTPSQGASVPRTSGTSSSASEVCIFTGGNFHANGLFEVEASKVSSFKAGASHAFGIVYEDENGRLSTVAPLPDAHVDWFDSEARLGKKGRSSMVIRIPETVKPPENAVKWFPVYSGNTTVGNFLQYTVNDSFNFSPQSTLQVPHTGNLNNRQYVSFRGFSGKETSYSSTYNPEISYSFASGDVMKIVSVGEQRNVNTEFPILDFTTLTSDENPLGTINVASADSGFEKTGDFFIIRSEDNENKFIAQGDSSAASGNAWRDKCLVEVRTPKFSSDNLVYHQIGDCFDIENAGASDRKHSGQRTATSFTGITVSTLGNTCIIFSSEKIFVGDKISVNLFPTEIVDIKQVTENTNEFIAIGKTIGSLSLRLNAAATAELSASQSNEAVVELYDGDVYFRKRILNYGYYDGNSNRLDSYIDDVEDYKFHDFIKNSSNDFGKPNAYSEDEIRVKRNSSITYSDAYVMDSDRLSLSSFNNSLANFFDIKNKYGAIQRLIDIEDAFYAVQEHKVSLYPVNRNIIQNLNEGGQLVTGDSVVNEKSGKAMSGDYGCGNDPEAVVYYEGVLYFVDRKANKVFSVSSSGIKEISDIFADSYIADKLEKADKGGEYNIYSGIDPNNDEYLLSTRTIVNKTIDVDQGNLYVLPANSGVGQADFTPHSVNSTTFGNFNLLNFNFEDVDVNFEDMGNGVLYVDDGFSDNAMQLDTPVDNLTSGTSNIVYTDKDNTFLGVAQVDNTNKFVTIV